MDYKDSKYHAPPNTTFMTYKEECEQLRIQVDLIKAQLADTKNGLSAAQDQLAECEKENEALKGRLSASLSYVEKEVKALVNENFGYAPNTSYAEKTITLMHDIRQCLSGFTTPSLLLKLRVFIDGNQWCAMYGENLQEGVAGFGDSPDKAVRNFDLAWNESLYVQKKDAERYRILRSKLYDGDIDIGEACLSLRVVGSCPTLEEFDAAISAQKEEAK